MIYPLLLLLMVGGVFFHYRKLRSVRNLYWQRGWLAGFFKAASCSPGDSVILPEPDL